MARLVTEYGLAAKFYNSTAAFDLGEVGLERAIWHYLNNNLTGWTPSPDPSHPGNTLYTLPHQFLKAHVGSVYLNIGEYDASISISADGTAAVISANGYVPNYSSYSAKRTLGATYKKWGAFTHAVSSLHNITMSGQAKADSYDSSKGAYNCILSGGSRNIGQKGSMASNGSITLSGEVYINGDATPGSGHPFPASPSPSTYISGKYGTMSTPITVDAAMTSALASTIAATKTSNSNSGITITHNGTTTPYTGGNNLSVSGQDVMTIPGGTYYFTAISTSGQAQINVTGPSVIYVDGGSINISGQGIVNSGQPKDMQIYSTGSTVSLSGQAAVTGAIYAPSATITLSGQENFYGSIFCGSDVDSGQAVVHYDTSLSSVTPSFATNGVTSWADIK